ncbi:MAG: SpoIIIAH-like family protein [Bacilli bacterium]|nr:SpoIIIAH-like family protein [Bacilli bacterium]
MINKNGLWFVTLFSLILVLGIYYVTTKNDEVLQVVNKTDEVKEVLETNESSILVSLKVKEEEEMLAEMESLQTILLDDTASLQEKNDAYNSLQTLNATKGKVEALEKKIKEKLNLDCFIKIKNDQISVTVASKEHNSTLANNIIRTIQEEYENKMYIVVKFQG